MAHCCHCCRNRRRPQVPALLPPPRGARPILGKAAIPGRGGTLQDRVHLRLETVPWSAKDGAYSLAQGRQATSELPWRCEL